LSRNIELPFQVGARHESTGGSDHPTTRSLWSRRSHQKAMGKIQGRPSPAAHQSQVSQNGWLLSRRGRSLPASAGGLDTHRDSMTSRFDRSASPSARGSSTRWRTIVGGAAPSQSGAAAAGGDHGIATNCRIVGKSQSVLVMINLVRGSRARVACVPGSPGLFDASNGSRSSMGSFGTRRAHVRAVFFGFCFLCLSLSLSLSLSTHTRTAPRSMWLASAHVQLNAQVPRRRDESREVGKWRWPGDIFLNSSSQRLLFSYRN
jgi:hypothetical protein